MRLQNTQPAAPTPAQKQKSQRFIIGENAVANTIFALGTGNFMAGLLMLLGASPSFCALVAALPQMGCALQLVSPFLFERQHSRKRTICLLCFGFRFSLGGAGVLALLFRGSPAALPVAFGAYFVAFMLAGFVTPGLNSWLLSAAPEEHRGRFFARRDILGTLVNAGFVYGMGALLDFCISHDRPVAGYFAVSGCILLLTLVDIHLLRHIWETPNETKTVLRAADLARPLRDKGFRGIIIFLMLWFAATGITNSYLSVYMLEVLGLGHGYVSFMVALSSVVGIGAIWLWGRVADRFGFQTLMLVGGVLCVAGYLGWFLLTPALAMGAAPFLQCLTTGGASASAIASLNIQFSRSPAKRKTAYLGVASAASNLTGYAAVLTASFAQPRLAVYFGQRSIALLFLAAAGFMLACVLYGRRLQRTPPEQPEEKNGT